MEISGFSDNRLSVEVISRSLSRGALCVSLFILISLNGFAASEEVELDARLNELSKSARWHSLLQLNAEKPLNTKTDLYINNNTNPLEQLKLTYQLFTTNDQAACRYPARARLLAETLSLEFKNLFPSKCVAYETYVNNFPVDNFHLIYTSENVTQASSMMGHIMLRADGVNSDGHLVQHGVTFFTELEGINVPKIMWQSLVSGKEGIFQIAPYAPFVDHYVNNEQRNVYEYQLILTDADRIMLRDAIWEFGQSQSAYFFHTYNCATVTQALLGVIAPTISPHKGQWLTPLDVLKAADSAHFLADARLRSSIEWRLQLLNRLIDSDHAKRIKDDIVSGRVPQINSTSQRKRVFEYHFASAYYDYQLSLDSQDKTYIKVPRLEFDKENQMYKETSIDIGQFKNPLRTPKDGQIHIGLDYNDNIEKGAVFFRAFPVNNSLYDDNREFYGENTLILSDLQFRLDQDGDVLFDHFKLYQMQTISDFEADFRRLSSSFSISAERRINQNGIAKVTGIVSGGLGLSKVFSTKAGIYGLAKVSAGVREGIYAIAEPEFGAYFYVGDTKFIGKTILRYNGFNHREWQFETQLSAVHFVKDDFSISLELTQVTNVRNNPLQVGMRAIFAI
uniref:lipoprotein N-acyltransferase Lnb domain-containing protein n=1 Tax=Ningiella ruwaisensis TaxID=2364274 RepID=UPI0010A06372|nr:DUF4105 domain-containing protein [Ningiella ruwaisensis]